MARLPRIVVPGFPHHVINRGNRRQIVFFSDQDKRIYCDLLMRELDKAGIALWAYCLMDNHVHLVSVPETKESLAKGIGEATRKYSLIINTRNGWRGHLWQERFNSYPMGESYLYRAVRYIERNPVRAGIVKKAQEYPWSSARAHVFGVKDELLSDSNFLISAIPDWPSYLNEENEEPDDSLRKLLRSHAQTGRPLGDKKFIEKLERLTGRSLKKKKAGRKKRKNY
jgi:putative transposase